MTADRRGNLENTRRIAPQGRRERRRKGRNRLSTDMRWTAVQAYWAMHVEAMTWSGMGVRQYAVDCGCLPTHCANGAIVSKPTECKSTSGPAFVRAPLSTSASSAAKQTSAPPSDCTKGIIKVSQANVDFTGVANEAPRTNDVAASSAHKRSSQLCWRASSREQR